MLKWYPCHTPAVLPFHLQVGFLLPSHYSLHPPGLSHSPACSTLITCADVVSRGTRTQAADACSTCNVACVGGILALPSVPFPATACARPVPSECTTRPAHTPPPARSPSSPRLSPTLSQHLLTPWASICRRPARLRHLPAALRVAGPALVHAPEDSCQQSTSCPPPVSPAPSPSLPAVPCRSPAPWAPLDRASSSALAPDVAGCCSPSIRWPMNDSVTLCVSLFIPPLSGPGDRPLLAVPLIVCTPLALSASLPDSPAPPLAIAERTLSPVESPPFRPIPLCTKGCFGVMGACLRIRHVTPCKSKLMRDVKTAHNHALSRYLTLATCSTSSVTGQCTLVQQARLTTRQGGRQGPICIPFLLCYLRLNTGVD